MSVTGLQWATDVQFQPTQLTPVVLTPEQVACIVANPRIFIMLGPPTDDGIVRTAITTLTNPKATFRTTVTIGGAQAAEYAELAEDAEMQFEAAWRDHER